MAKDELIKLLERQIELRKAINESRGPVGDRIFIDGHTFQNPESTYDQYITCVHVKNVEKLGAFAEALGVSTSNYDGIEYFIHEDAIVLALEEDNEYDTI